jgi:ABC-type glutathione transport system ATPase component
LARDGAIVLMVSHRPGNLRLADHVILLEAGRLAETGPVAALARDPSSRTGALLAPGADRAGRSGRKKWLQKSGISTKSAVD